jgi:hypothetical protein
MHNPVTLYTKCHLVPETAYGVRALWGFAAEMGTLGSNNKNGTVRVVGRLAGMLLTPVYTVPVAMQSAINIPLYTGATLFSFGAFLLAPSKESGKLLLDNMTAVVQSICSVVVLVLAAVFSFFSPKLIDRLAPCEDRTHAHNVINYYNEHAYPNLHDEDENQGERLTENKSHEHHTHNQQSTNQSEMLHLNVDDDVVADDAPEDNL